MNSIRTAQGHLWIEFKNGLTLSIFNGYGSYTENHYKTQKFSQIMHDRDILAEWESKNMEIAIMRDGIFVTNEVLEDTGDDVKGYIPVNKLPELIKIVKIIEMEMINNVKKYAINIV